MAMAENSSVNDVQEKVREEIERTLQEGKKRLSLPSYLLGEPLHEIPDVVFGLTELEELDLTQNNIRVVPERIRELTNLKRLFLFHNPVEKLPDIPGVALNWTSYLRCRKHLSRQHVDGILIEIDGLGRSIPKQSQKQQLWQELARLPNLHGLFVRGRHASAKDVMPEPSSNVRELIDRLGSFGQLEALGLSGLLLEEVPTGIRELKRLRSLDLSAAGLREIPDWIGELEQLRLLLLGQNPLTSLPSSLVNLSELALLYLHDTQLAVVPEVVFELTSLKSLNLSRIRTGYKGQIKQIPGAILRLSNLVSLQLLGQPIEIPPPEVTADGVEAIKNYWRQQQEVGVDYLAEAKLIIVGEAGAGKTSLAKKIKDPAYDLNLKEDSTEGIDVIRWSFPSALRVRRDGQEELHPTEFKASIWDFGGQEIYHATHQFFLTRRSLYALVADDRKEDTDFNWWLQIVEMLSDRSPLFIVQNEKQDRQRDIDLGTLRAHFPNLREAFRVNLSTNRGVEQLTTAIRQELERLPHIGTPLPKTWSKVRAALEGDPRHYVSLDEYLAICEANGFTRREDKLQLSGYLHDLGISLHFQDDPVLKNTVILKPKWGTNAVYRVLDDHTILDHRGRFGPDDLARIWCDPEYSSMRDELLQLMMRFQLCYQLPDRPAYIAPQLLSPTRPAYDWTGDGGLILRYEYEFMPKGILTRFIVAVNHLIENQDFVWKSGVILAREGARAEVIEDYTRRKITVRANGTDARGLLAIVDDQLERIHATFPRLKYDKLLPCICEVCQEREEPFAYPLSELRDFAMEGAGIQCRVSRKLVDAAELIRKVLLPSAVEPIVMGTHRVGLLPEPPAPEHSREVFVSYAWTDESSHMVDRLEEALAKSGVTLVRDRNEMRYKDSIRGFMKRIGRGKFIVVVVSKNYLESTSCMFEMTEIVTRGDIRNRVFPIVLPDADIYNARGRLRYIKHWEQKKAELDKEMKAVGGEYLQGIREELDLYALIRQTIAKITDLLGDMNALTVDAHQGSGFSSLIESVKARLSEER